MLTHLLNTGIIGLATTDAQRFANLQWLIFAVIIGCAGASMLIGLVLWLIFRDRDRS